MADEEYDWYCSSCGVGVVTKGGLVGAGDKCPACGSQQFTTENPMAVKVFILKGEDGTIHGAFSKHQKAVDYASKAGQGKYLIVETALDDPVFMKINGMWVD